MRGPGEHGEDPAFHPGKQVIRGKGIRGGSGENAGALQAGQRGSSEGHQRACVSRWHREGAAGGCANTS